MENYINLLKTIPLFEQIEEKEIRELLNCFSAGVVTYKAGETVFMAGEKPQNIGIVISGSVQVIYYDFYGNRTIIATNTRGQLFAESYVCASVDSLPVSVVAAENTEILFLDFNKVIFVCSRSCAFHSRLIFNMLKITANKNILLNQKLQIITKRTIREKILAYLSMQAARKKSKSFFIPFNRQELADFLSVDRSALSNELGKLQKDNIIKFKKNHFTLLQSVDDEM